MGYRVRAVPNERDEVGGNAILMGIVRVNARVGSWLYVM